MCEIEMPALSTDNILNIVALAIAMLQLLTQITLSVGCLQRSTIPISCSESVQRPCCHTLTSMKQHGHVCVARKSRYRYRIQSIGQREEKLRLER